jgi:hypothetical protein
MSQFVETPEIIATHQVIKNTILEFNRKDPLPVKAFAQTSADVFGILTVEIQKTNINKHPIYLLFTVDKTFSMDDYADRGFKNRGMKKIHYLINTFKNMINYLSKLHDIPILIHVQSFNTTVDITVDDVKVTELNSAEIIDKIQNLEVDGLTNIEIALKCANEKMHKYRENNPTHKIAHIFMTDGEATIGEKDDDELACFVDEEFVNIFVGFGENHNAELLHKFSEKKNVEYYFVDNAKNTGCVYGQIMHRLLYSAIENVKISIDHGGIYNWKTNQWEQTIVEDVLLSSLRRVYHIRSSLPEDATIRIYGDVDGIAPYSGLLDTTTALPKLIDPVTEENVEITDLTKYVFRQKVQEMLYTLSRPRIAPPMRFVYDEIQSTLTHKENKHVLAKLYRTMKKYMSENNATDDPFMVLLCNDVRVAYAKMGTSQSTMYISARQTSQGRQLSYTATPPETMRHSPPRRRNPKIESQAYLFNDKITQTYYESDEDSFSSTESPLDDEPGFANNNASCYATKDAIDLMQTLSQRIN